jgi:monofunctional biosynthetic peptidoglycan transglycosylase
MSSRPEKRPLWFRLARALIIAILVIVLAPYCIVPFYRFVDPVSAPMLGRWATGARVVRITVSLERMSRALPATVIAAEDAHFCSHYGIDWGELRDVLGRSDDLSDARGASTLSQQVAKNLFLWGGRSYVRKALELPLALWIDLVLPKRRILEIYLNIAEWGPNGEFGAEAASRFAFARSARELSPREAALLAAVLPNPHRRSARVPSAAVRRLAGIYEARARTASIACLQ